MGRSLIRAGARGTGSTAANAGRAMTVSRIRVRFGYGDMSMPVTSVRYRNGAAATSASENSPSQYPDGPTTLSNWVRTGATSWAFAAAASGSAGPAPKPPVGLKPIACASTWKKAGRKVNAKRSSIMSTRARAAGSAGYRSSRPSRLAR